MALRDTINDSQLVVLLEAQDLAHADTASAWVYWPGFSGVELFVVVGALTGVDGDNYLTPILQGGTTTAASGAAAVDSGDIIGDGFSKIDAAAEDSTIQRAQYVGDDYTYLRVLLDYTGTGITAGIVGVYALLTLPRVSPATQVGTAVAAT